MGYKAFATIVGATIGLVFPGALSVSLGLHGACVAVAICCAIVLLVSGFIVVYTFKERPSISLTANSPFALSVMQALRNPPFRTVILCTILAQLGNDMAFGVMPFYTDYVLEAKEPGALFAFMAAMNLFTRLCLIPVYAKLMNWMGKKRTAILSAILCAASGPSLLLLNKDNCENYLVVALVCSFNGGSAAAWELLNPTLLADTIDYDELLSGQRREAMYMGLLTVLPAFIDIPAAVVPLNLMGNAGYVADKHPQNNAVVAVIIMCMVVIPACCMAIVAVVYTTYPIRDDAHQAQVKQAAAARSSYEEVIDPVTGAQLPALARDRQSDDRDYFYSREKTLAKKCGGHKGLEAILLMELGLVLAFAGMAVYIIADGVDGLGSGEETWAPVGIAMLVMASGIVYFNWSRLTVARNMRRDNKDSENVETKTLESGTQHEQVEHSMIAM